MRLTIDRDVKSSRRGRRVARKVSTSVSAAVSRVSLSMVRLHFGNKFIKRKLRSPAFFWEGGGAGGEGRGATTQQGNLLVALVPPVPDIRKYQATNPHGPWLHSNGQTYSSLPAVRRPVTEYK